MDETDAAEEVDLALAEAHAKRPKQADVLIDIGRTAKLFRTRAPDCDAHADILIDGHRETWRVRSKGFRGWLRHRYFQRMEAGCNAEAMQVAVETLVAFAQFDKDTIEHEVGVRVAGHDGAIYIDIGDPQWRIVEVTSAGWKVIDSVDAPVRFRRSPSMRPLPIPTEGGSLKDLRKLVNVRTEDDFVLLVAYALAALRPDCNYPVLGVAGVQGSAKSTLIRLLQRLIDPRAPKMRSIPREEDDLIVAAKGAHFLGFDNVSRLSDEMSDAICRLSTGGGSGKRQLYTDDEEILFNGTRPVAFNGIEDCATRPDLVERTILLWLARPKRRRREKEIDAAFEKAASGIFGALLTGLVTGLQGLDEIDDSDLPRMADFAAWAEACCRAYWPAETFLKAYKWNLQQAVEVVLEASPVATAVRALMAERTEWEGSATALLIALTETVGERAAKEKDWPKRPNVLSNKLRRVIPDLAKVGIIISGSREGHDRARTFTITNESRPLPDPDPEHRGETASSSSASSYVSDSNGLGRTMPGKKIVREASSDRPRGTTKRDNGAADDQVNDENPKTVRSKSLKANNMDDADGPDDVSPTLSGNGHGDRGLTCAHCGGAGGRRLQKLSWGGELVPLHRSCIGPWVEAQDTRASDRREGSRQ
jgi:hypothetical protein